MKKILALLLIAGLLISACCIQVAAESTDDVDADSIDNEYFGGPHGGLVPCGGEAGNGGNGTLG
jgi:hypothetical protein